STAVPGAAERSTSPAAARAMASRTVRSSPARRASAGVAAPNAAKAAAGSMPMTPAMVAPKPKWPPTTSSSGVIDVTAVRRLKAASVIPARARSPPRAYAPPVLGVGAGIRGHPQAPGRRQKHEAGLEAGFG